MGTTPTNKGARMLRIGDEVSVLGVNAQVVLSYYALDGRRMVIVQWADGDTVAIPARQEDAE